MIHYQKKPRLRIEASTAPQTPFWQRTMLSPYGEDRSRPVSLDYGLLSASARSHGEVAVCTDVADQLARTPRTVEEPILIDATGSAEQVFRRGEILLRTLERDRTGVLHLIDTDGVMPRIEGTSPTIAVSCWPPRLDDLRAQFAEAAASGLRWGAVIPLLFPLTTRLSFLERIADEAAHQGAAFLAGIPFDLEPTAKSALAASIDSREEDAAFTTLFHEDLELVVIASERHVAALAAERGLADWIRAGSEEPSNWKAATVLAVAGTRMVRMKRRVELGWTLLRSARHVAQLPKPLTTIAASASLSIIEPLDEVSSEVLSEWLEQGTAELLDEVDRAWRLRRDHRANEE